MRRPGSQRVSAILEKARLFLRSRRGNVALITAFVAPVVVFASGMGIDYTLAASRRAQLDGIADAAALAAVTPNEMLVSSSLATTAATNVFNAQAALVGSITYSSSNLTVTVNDVTTGAKIVRTATVTYTAGSNNVFAGVLGLNQIAIGGTSTATSTNSPKTDFYLLLDDSPSMALAATSSGIATMEANTQSQCDSGPPSGKSCGCAFGCHESNPAGESHWINSTTTASGLGNPGGEDNYALAHALGVTLRIDLLNTATQNLMSVAQTTETNNNTTYRVALYTMDTGVNVLQALTANLTTAQSAAANIGPQEVYDNNCLTSTNCNNDEDTNYDAAMSAINTAMPNPGNGTSAPGDTPQEVLMIVTDGMEDEPTPSGYSTLNSSGGGRQQYWMNADYDWCTAIKNRGIRIAILYTQYLPIVYNGLPNNGWYWSFDSTSLPTSSGATPPTPGVAWMIQPTDQVGAALKNCASSGLFFEVTTDGDISAAMSTLFQEAVNTARLSN